MKYLLIIPFFVFTTVYAQKKAEKKLYYFISKDSLVGVKDVYGKIIISAINYNEDNVKENEIVKNSLLYFHPFDMSNAEPHSFGLVYNRNGEILYAPFSFETGPDGIYEGMSRFVKNNKVGFVNRAGQIVIPARFDWVGSFNYGIAEFCNGCTWKHQGENPFVKGGTWGYINKKGETIISIDKKATDKDQYIDSGKYLPYQFSYSGFEQKIIDSFNKMTIISKLHFVNYYSKLDSNERVLDFEIIECPSSFYPYYHIKAFEITNGRGYDGDDLDYGTNFYVTKDGKKYLADDYGTKIPLSTWLKKQKAEAKKYLKEHKDALYKF